MDEAEAADDGLVVNVPPSFVAEFADHILGTIPKEKVQCELRQEKLARVMKQAGSSYIPGVGQKIAEIDPRLYFRMLHSFGHEENWLKDFLADNPQLCAPGYRPRGRQGLRKGKTFIDGKPV